MLLCEGLGSDDECLAEMKQKICPEDRLDLVLVDFALGVPPSATLAFV